MACTAHAPVLGLPLALRSRPARGTSQLKRRGGGDVRVQGRLRLAPGRGEGLVPTRHAVQVELPRARPLHKRQLLCRGSAVIVADAGSEPPKSQGLSVQTRIIFGCACSLLLCNMCRVCMSIAIMPMSDQFGWTSSTQGLIQSSFLWGYAATQILGGALADQLGGKVVMRVGIAVFAAACAVLPFALWAAQSLALASAGLIVPLVIISRAFVGLGEGVTMPSMNNLLATYVPPASRARSIGAIFSGFHAGTLLGLLCSPLILINFGWPALFGLYGALGLPLLFLWQNLVPEVEANKLAAAQPSDGNPFAMLLSNKATWAIISANFVNHFNYFIYLNWMPLYFNKVIGFSIRDSALYSFLPWLVMSLMSYVAGWIADTLINKGMGKTSVRKLIQSTAFIGPMLALGPLVTTKSPEVAVACFTTAMSLGSFSQAGYLPNMSDIAPRYAGRLFGLANTAGSLAGVLGTAVVGFIVEKTGTWAAVFQTMVGVYLLGLIAFNTLCTAEQQFK